jgi:hypothetical protein
MKMSAIHGFITEDTGDTGKRLSQRHGEHGDRRVITKLRALHYTFFLYLYDWLILCAFVPLCEVLHSVSPCDET